MVKARLVKAMTEGSIARRLSQSEILCNRERAFAVMDKYELDALCVSDARNVHYLSNFDSNLLWNWSWVAFAILPRDESRPATLLCSGLDLPTLLATLTWMPEIRTYALHDSGREAAKGDFRPNVRKGAALGQVEQKALDLYAAVPHVSAPNPESALGAVLKELSLDRSRLGVDDWRLAQRLRDGPAENATFQDARDIMREIRLVKTAAEVERLRGAARRNEAALKAAIAATSVGVLWRNVVETYQVEMIRQGGMPLYLIRGAGERAGARTQVMDYAVQTGDLVFYDALGQFHHYHGDIGRTAHMGEAPAEVRATIDAMRVGWREGCDKVRPGMRANDLSQIIRDAARKAGFPASIRQAATVHSLGLEHFDHPQDQGFYQDFAIESGCVLNVDMPYVEFGWGSMHIEDTVLVTSTDSELLTSNETALIELTENRS